MLKLGAQRSKVGIELRFQSRYNVVMKTVSKYVDNSEKLKYDEIRTCVRTSCIKGDLSKMRDKELELIRMVREAEEPEAAIVTAIEIISEFLAQHESFQVQEIACLPVLC